MRWAALLCELNIELEKNEDDFFTQNISSLFHGVIMEKIEKSYADIMHISQIRPYRQSLQIERTRILWTICSVTEESYKNIIVPLMDDGFDKVYLNQKNKEFPIISKKLKKISIDDFLSGKFPSKGERVEMCKRNQEILSKILEEYQVGRQKIENILLK